MSDHGKPPRVLQESARRDLAAIIREIDLASAPEAVPGEGEYPLELSETCVWPF